MNKSRPPPSLKILPSPNLNAIVLSRGDATWLNKVHKHEIWKGKDGRWCSYVNTNDGKRKVIRKATLAIYHLILHTVQSSVQTHHNYELYLQRSSVL